MEKKIKKTSIMTYMSLYKKALSYANKINISMYNLISMYADIKMIDLVNGLTEIEKKYGNQKQEICPITIDDYLAKKFKENKKKFGISISSQINAILIKFINYYEQKHEKTNN